MNLLYLCLENFPIHLLQLISLTHQLLTINTKSEELAEKKEEVEQLEEELIKIESRISDDVIPYEKFSNFFKKAGQTIKSNQNTYLLDQLLRNVFLNFFVENGKVIGHRLKEPFSTYESLGVKSGVDDRT